MIWKFIFLLLFYINFYFTLLLYFYFQEEEFENYVKSENAGWMISESDLEMNDTVKSQPKPKSDTSLSYSDTVLKNSHTAQDLVKAWMHLFSK